MIVATGSTSQSFVGRVVDDSGLPVTGLVASTFPSLSHYRAGGALTSITLSDLSTLNSAWGSGGIKEVGSGYYRLDLPDAALATAGSVKVIGSASGKRWAMEEIQVGYAPANVAQWLGTAVGANTAGTPTVDVMRWQGSTEAADYIVTGAQNVDVAVSTRATPAQVSSSIAGSTNIVVISPVTGSTIDIIRGDSYNNTHGRALDFTIVTGEPWPTDLTGWTITFTATKRANVTASGDTTLTVTGSVVTPTGSSRKVRLELTAANTDTLAVGVAAYVWDIQASSGSERATLRSGTMTVREDQTTA